MEQSDSLKKYLMKKPAKKKKESKREIYNPNLHIKEVIDALENELENQKYNPWNKLDTSIKLNRIINYINSENIKNNMSDEQYECNKKFLINLFTSNKLNKITDVNYDCESGMIIELFKYKLENNIFKES